jgi:hypothetical protein
LLAVLKMKLKVAARRRHARDRGVTAPDRGALDEDELSVFTPMLELLLDALQLEGSARIAARELSTRRDHPQHARAWMEALTSINQRA